MDIEGGEYLAIEDLLASRLPVPQLLVEFHHHFPGIGLRATQRAVAALQEAGYRIFHISQRGLEISFVHLSAQDGCPPVSAPATPGPSGRTHPPR
jgi:hypothetical protein